MSKKRKMYLDVDGVLIVWDTDHNCVELSHGLGRLMRFCLLHDIEPFWLSMWCKDGEVPRGLNSLFWPGAAPTMVTPKPVAFGDKGKAAAIDYDSDFVSIVDGIGPEDIETLEKHGATDRFFWTDGLNPNCLLEFMEFTREKMGLPEVEDWGPAWDSPFARARLPETDPNRRTVSGSGS